MGREAKRGKGLFVVYCLLLVICCLLFSWGGGGLRIRNRLFLEGLIFSVLLASAMAGGMEGPWQQL